MGEINELLSEGISITLLGLGVVFVLLTVLVGVLHLMSALARAVGATSADRPAATAAPRQRADTDDELVAVIGAAIERYRSQRLSAH